MSNEHANCRIPGKPAKRNGISADLLPAPLPGGVKKSVNSVKRALRCFFFSKEETGNSTGNSPGFARNLISAARFWASCTPPRWLCHGDKGALSGPDRDTIGAPQSKNWMIGTQCPCRGLNQPSPQQERPNPILRNVSAVERPRRGPEKRSRKAAPGRRRPASPSPPRRIPSS